MTHVMQSSSGLPGLSMRHSRNSWSAVWPSSLPNGARSSAPFQKKSPSPGNAAWAVGCASSNFSPVSRSFWWRVVSTAGGMVESLLGAVEVAQVRPGLEQRVDERSRVPGLVGGAPLRAEPTGRAVGAVAQVVPVGGEVRRPRVVPLRRDITGSPSSASRCSTSSPMLPSGRALPGSSRYPEPPYCS